MKRLTYKEAYDVFVKPYENKSCCLCDSFSRVAFEIIQKIYKSDTHSLAGLIDLEMLKDLIDKELGKGE